MGYTILVSKCDRHPYRIVNGVRLRLCSVGWQANPPASLIGSSQGTTQELNPWGAQVNLGLPSQIVLADSLLEDFSVGKVEDNSTLGSRGYRPDLFTQSHNPQGLLYTVTGRLRALRDVLLEGRMGRGKGEGKRGWRCPMKCVGPSREESCYCRSIRGDKDG